MEIKILEGWYFKGFEDNLNSLIKDGWTPKFESFNCCLEEHKTSYIEAKFRYYIILVKG